MKKILYITNIAVPYRVRFFNELAKHCSLTVLYESSGCQQRSRAWADSEPIAHRACYFPKDLPGIRKERYDAIILGCYQTPLQITANLLLRLGKVPFLINLDGEPFLEGKGLKTWGKRFLLSGAAGYLAAGENAARSLQAVAGEKSITPYYFSSLLHRETRREDASQPRTDTILVVGQYFPYKGLDVALEAARRDPGHAYCFVGMGRRTKKFLREHTVPENVRVIPFLQKKELEWAYETCALLVLPSRRECWGLVVNEAAAFGMPIVSTWGSGAAVEFLGEKYPQYLASPGDPEDLLRCIRLCLEGKDRSAYSAFLREKTKNYDIERSVQAHLTALEGELP